MQQKHTRASKYNIFVYAHRVGPNNFSKGSRATRLRVCGPRVISVSARMCLCGVRV